MRRCFISIPSISPGVAREKKRKFSGPSSRPKIGVHVGPWRQLAPPNVGNTSILTYTNLQVPHHPAASSRKPSTWTAPPEIFIWSNPEGPRRYYISSMVGGVFVTKVQLISFRVPILHFLGGNPTFTSVALLPSAMRGDHKSVLPRLSLSRLNAETGFEPISLSLLWLHNCSKWRIIWSMYSLTRIIGSVGDSAAVPSVPLSSATQKSTSALSRDKPSRGNINHNTKVSVKMGQ